MGIKFRRGTLNVIAGPPGSMKTLFLLNMIRNMGQDTPVLYHSSDSDDFTVATRTLAMLTGEDSGEAEIAIMGRSEAAYERLKDFDHVRWSFRSSPTIDSLRNEAEAFCELYGDYPALTVTDILMDIDYDGVTEQNYWGLMPELKDMARDFQTCMVVAHHTSESAKPGSPPPRSAVMGKANQSPALILTLWGDSVNGTLEGAVVKNRFGPQDPEGNLKFKLKANPQVCLIEEEEEEETPLLFRDGPEVPREQKIDIWGDDE